MSRDAARATEQQWFYASSNMVRIGRVGGEGRKMLGGERRGETYRGRGLTGKGLLEADGLTFLHRISDTWNTTAHTNHDNNSQ